jgi:hypothetical protein
MEKAAKSVKTWKQKQNVFTKNYIYVFFSLKFAAGSLQYIVNKLNFEVDYENSL